MASMRRIVGAVAVLAALSAPALGEARRASKGPYAEAGIGATQFLGTGGEYSALGPSFAIRIGYDLFSFLSLGARIDTSMHEATVPPPPEGEYFQLYTGAAEARLGFNVWHLGVFADAGVGGSYMSTNILEKVDILEPGEKFTLMFSGGGGMEYQLQNRHYAFGLAGMWSTYPSFGDGTPISAITARAYLRYTY